MRRRPPSAPHGRSRAAGRSSTSAETGFGACCDTSTTTSGGSQNSRRSFYSNYLPCWECLSISSMLCVLCVCVYKNVGLTKESLSIPAASRGLVIRRAAREAERHALETAPVRAKRHPPRPGRPQRPRATKTRATGSERPSQRRTYQGQCNADGEMLGTHSAMEER